LNLPKLSKKIEEWKNESIKSNGWSQTAISITEAWLKNGLEERCITRDLSWGTKVPLEEFKNKVFYVWFDAPVK
jgi:methionyl-tRNA synthetase